MSNQDNYIEINKKSWNERVEIHIDSDFYDNKSFLEGRSSLNEIELNLLGNIEGKSILHLQCHFGQDTISLSRMGAHTVGVDFSETAINQAVELANKTNTTAKFICCDLYDLPSHLNDKFDIVFTSYGTIGWLPDLNKWASLIQSFLKPKGQFVFAEFHPVVWMFDNDFLTIEYRYFKSEPIIETEAGTYADPNAPINPESITWNHGLSEVITALIDHGMEIEKFQEYDYSPYNCFNETVEVAPNQFRIKHLENKIPMVYSILASLKDSSK